jgi:uncharacterized protein (TIGR03437 family)
VKKLRNLLHWFPFGDASASLRYRRANAFMPAAVCLIFAGSAIAGGGPSYTPAHILYWADHFLGTDNYQPAFLLRGDTVTTASGSADLVSKLTSGTWDVVVVSVNNSTYPAISTPIANYISMGGRVVLNDWYVDAIIDGATQATAGMPNNQTVATINAAGISSGLADSVSSNPFTLTNSHWGVFSQSLTPVAPAVSRCDFVVGSCAVFGNSGRTMRLAFIPDTLPAEDAARILANSIEALVEAPSLVVPPPAPATPMVLSVYPTALNIQYQQGTAFTSGNQPLYITESGTGSSSQWTATTAGAGWLTLSNASGSPGSPETAMVNTAGLAPGVYTGSIVVSMAQYGLTTTVPVTFTVLAPAAISVNETEMAFAVTEGQTAPTTANLTISTPGIAWSVQQEAPAQPWLTLSSSFGVAPSTVNLSLNPTGLGAGSYYASLLLSSPGAPNSPVTVSVRFIVGTGLLISAPLVNAASSALSSTIAIAPNEAISLYLPGINCPGVDGVTVNNLPVAVLAAAGDQVNVVLPEFLPSSALTVSCSGSLAWAFYGLQVAPSVPGIFTTSQNGAGQGTIANEDGTMNSANNPANTGSIVAVYATGLGAYQSASADGLRRIAGTVAATVGGVAAPVPYAGQIPGTTLGVSQINVQIPEGITPGAAVPVVLTVNGVATQAGVTLAIQ